ncbi:MAG: glycosyltransferase family 1 protein [Comamonas sp.]
MSELKPTIWMNVTTSAGWNRPPVGIVRVEKSLVSELKEIYLENFKLCVWNGHRFIEWDSEKSIEKLPSPEEKKQKNSELNTLSQGLIYPIVGKEQALAYIAQGLLSLMPKKIMLWLNRFFFWSRPRIARWMQKNSHPVKKVFTQFEDNISTKEANNSEIFKPDDILISVGLDWDHGYYSKFYSLRNDKKLKIVTCCYDLIPVLYPQYCVGEVAGIFTSYFLEIADASDLVLCISQQSERDFHELLNRTGGARPVTQVFPLGDNVSKATSVTISDEINSIVKEDFILFVSSIERRKNHEVLYRAYHLLCAEGKRERLPKIVFVGMKGWGVGDLMKDIELDPITQGLIIQFNHVSDAELRKLYESALFCVFPSLYEGWGLPVGEALSMGKVVISSNRGSLPEVGGDLVRYIDPWDPRAWAIEMYRMATDHVARKELEEKILTQYKSRTWRMSALSISKGIEKIYAAQ